ncbi:hypothetical protein [Roseibium aggregatum]|uniref:Peptidoglycan binding-like domain-containing protein n=1 Tax=Roseibium aggregatum TaxID=187304 RepID=A0A0M6YBY4_9HYPH|nr:hypothetical protein [Roseibium aggregatum]CTQ47605.1 hypothetical protein LAL4801_06067 [Roseibium aggregatum]
MTPLGFSNFGFRAPHAFRPVLLHCLSIVCFLLPATIFAAPATADFIAPDGSYGRMATQIWHGRFKESSNNYSPRLKKEAVQLIVGYHRTFADLCKVRGKTKTIKFILNDVVQNSFAVREEYAEIVLDAMNYRLLDTRGSSFFGRPMDPEFLYSANKVSRQIIMRNGCESSETWQFEENLARFVSVRPSLQETRQVETTFMRSCQNTAIAGLEDETDNSVGEVCSCLEKIISEAGIRRRYLDALETSFSLQRLLGLLASNSGLWNQGRSCLGSMARSKTVGESQVGTSNGPLTLDSTKAQLYAEFARIGCVLRPQDITNSLKERTAIRCLQSLAGSDQTGRLTERDLAVLASLPDKLLDPTKRKKTRNQVKTLRFDEHLGSWQYRIGDYPGKIVIGRSDSEPDLPGVTYTLAEMDVEFPDLGILVHEHWNYNEATLEILAIQAYGPVWRVGQDTVSPGMLIEGTIQRLELSVRQARRENEKYGAGSGATVTLPIVKMADGKPMRTQTKSLDTFALTVPIGAPRGGEWLRTPQTPLEHGLSYYTLEDRRAALSELKSRIDGWIKEGSCGISDRQIMEVDAAFSTASILMGTRSHEGALLSSLKYERDLACEKQNNNLPLQDVIRYHMINASGCAFTNEAGMQELIERAKSSTLTKKEFSLGILSRVTDDNLSENDANCIGASLRAEFLQ